mgnify:CR=1 FL=1
MHQANGGILILSAATMLSQFDLWQRLKHILQTQALIGIQLIHLNLACDIPSYPLNLKVVI